MTTMQISTMDCKVIIIISYLYLLFQSLLLAAALSNTNLLCLSKSLVRCAQLYSFEKSELG